MLGINTNTSAKVKKLIQRYQDKNKKILTILREKKID